MLLVGNGKLITRDSENPYFEDGAVVIDGEAVKAVGALADMRAKYPDAGIRGRKGSGHYARPHQRPHPSTRGWPGAWASGQQPHQLSGGPGGDVVEHRPPPHHGRHPRQRLRHRAGLHPGRRPPSSTTTPAFCKIPGSLFAIKDVCREAGDARLPCYGSPTGTAREKSLQSIQENADFARRVGRGRG